MLEMDTTAALIQLALNEDLGVTRRDITTDVLFGDHCQKARAYICSKDRRSVVIAGIEVAKHVFRTLDPQCHFSHSVADGDVVAKGDKVLMIRGNKLALLKAERTALNFLRHLSGIATLTAEFVAKVAHTQLKILDTRKTTPGMRVLEKHAVASGGGVNHRMGLYDAIMIKDTHIDMAGGLAHVLAKMPLLAQQNVPIIFEIQSETDLKSLLASKPPRLDRILLDNMSLEALRRCVEICKGVVDAEASGNINLDTVAEIAETGVDYASVGMLTHSALNADLSMKIG